LVGAYWIFVGFPSLWLFFHQNIGFLLVLLVFSSKYRYFVGFTCFFIKILGFYWFWETNLKTDETGNLAHQIGTISSFVFSPMGFAYLGGEISRFFRL
jgi:hypothetical protein